MQPINIKNLCLVGFLIASMSTHAADGPPPRGKPDFLTMKQEMIARLKTELACVEAAKDDGDLRSCRPKPPQGGPGGPRSQSNLGSGVIADNNNNLSLPDF